MCYCGGRFQVVGLNVGHFFSDYDILWTWAVATGVAALVFAVLYLVKTVVLRRLTAIAAGTKSKIDDIAVRVMGKTHVLFLIILGAYAGSSVLALSPGLRSDITRVAVLAFFLQCAIWGSAFIDEGVGYYLEKHDGDAVHTVVTAGALAVLGRVIVWAAVGLAALANLGLNVTALVAGLGVSSVAVALAVQNILGDLFAAISIVLDRPFVVGDFIIVDTYLGTVEHIGLKSTRIRSLDGELMVFSNGDLLKSRIRNYQNMYERRILFSLGVTYDTPYEKLAAVPGMIREIIEGQEKTRFERAHFKTYGDFSLNFEIVYHVNDPDYNVYMDIQQAINLAVYRRFAKEGIEFAFPTQTVLLDQTNVAEQGQGGQPKVFPGER